MSTPPQDVERGPSRSPSPPPPDFASEQWYSPVSRAYHRIAGSQLMTYAGDAAGWVAENRGQIVSAAVDGLAPASVALQSIGTGLNDSAQGARSAYNWGVVLSGAEGLRTVLIQGSRAFRPHPSDPPDVLSGVLGAARVAGAAAYGLAPTAEGRAVGAAVQSLGIAGDYALYRYRASQQSQQATPVSSVAPQLPAQEFPSTLSVNRMWDAANAQATDQQSPPATPQNPTPQNPTTQTPTHEPEPSRGGGRGRGQDSSATTTGTSSRIHKADPNKPARRGRKG
ncbi:hypothetical protein ABZX82_05085 [Streptomyces griseoflavus]|uniref:hypothetical protein n=1 Tax=Streptomyces griseoflavus TaxID=35619 RepID=UPI00167D1A47|nr:hypothetical protein [Streptomyces griseoflavus]GGV17963.1 hypothetical protein GCM10010293_11890 [Streptomyces griseoflavus]